MCERKTTVERQADEPSRWREHNVAWQTHTEDRDGRLYHKRHARGHIRNKGWMPSWSWRPLPGKGVGEGNRCPRLENEKVTA